MVKNIAHRGFSGRYPENTLLAFEKALAEGVDGIELDVQLSSDGIPVIMHDELVDRTTEGTGRIMDMTCKELKKLNVSHCFPEYGIISIPTLEEYLELIKDYDIISNIELKTGVYEYQGIEQKVYDLAKEYGILNHVIISSFNHHSVLRMKEINQDIKCAILDGEWLINVAEYAAAAGIEYYHPIFHSVSPRLAEEINARKILINAWTVNEENDIRAMLTVGVNGIITDYPDRVNMIRWR